MDTRAAVAGMDERLLEELLGEAHAAGPGDLPEVVARSAAALGLDRAVIYLVDLQQRDLVPLGEGERSLAVDSSLAGWAYRTLSVRVEENGAAGLAVWFPLVDGAERLGVLGVWTETLSATRLRRCRMLASLTAMVITSKRAHSDSFARLTRTESMRLPAEMLRAFLPPRTIGNAQVVSTAVLEPAYEIGGDAFDHSLTQTELHAAILDAMGHDLASGLTTSVALAGCRNGRRNGVQLPRLVETVDEALSQWLPDQFCTGVLLELDLAGGALRWCNCGHPPPLLIRDEHVVAQALDRPAEPPMGMPAQFMTAPREVHEAQLEPGDRVLLYTDGVTEARVHGGAQLGTDRFTDSIIRATAAGEPASEALRRLIHEILDRQADQLRDDATMLLIEWKPPPRP
ncbi:PP2C family protein-serine/threonine phosphatase [Streptomyces sp. URMC 123]|uniref:PP2C family protein-serine/threonine phosphatase n=1 Tax=Streptomyces sp. URMC 123 TaxID=3423403 RepID=UPI003F1C2675